MLNNLDLTNVLFLDIETVSGFPAYSELNDDFKKLWHLKTKSILRRYEDEISEEEVARTYEERAAIFAEFGKIVCISVGILRRDKDGKLNVRLKSFADKDEKKLLADFAELLSNYYNNPTKHFLCGHNMREFDVPYMCRRYLLNQMHLPEILDVAGKKPWETKHILDTMELWKFGDYKNYTSLKLLAAAFGFPSPKDDIDGSEVGRVFWKEDDLPRIAKYCEKDVLAVVQLLLKYKCMPILEEPQIAFV